MTLAPKTHSFPGPNAEVLEAQARVCTGPHQSRPLGKKPGDPQPGPVLEKILQTLREELPIEQQVSSAQMGAFFAAMTLRKSYPPETGWSPAETEAFKTYGPDLETLLPAEISFLLLPSRSSPLPNTNETLRTSLVPILSGAHLTYSQTRNLCESILAGKIHPALAAAALIGQRMNRETHDEVRGYLDAVFPPERILQVNTHSLTHMGEPYDGSTRYFRPTIFIAAVRAALGRPTVLHGVDHMPPKSGVTEEQILDALGARTDLNPEQAVLFLEDPAIGFAYISQREYAPGAYALRDLRAHIKKRPPWAATEKVQQLFSCPGDNFLIAGYYHPGYEQTLLRLMEERNLTAGLVIKGLEGTSHYALRSGKPSDEARKAINFSQGFRHTGNQREPFEQDVDPNEFGYHYAESPRPEIINAEAFAHAGTEALSGEQGPALDQILFNTALKDHLLGLCKDPQESLDLARETIHSGRALSHLKTYIAATRNQKPSA
ncbi:MAG: hypothetical protein O2954_13595 [bacterium]|nr:hypothetical protein [bacterium]